MRIEPGRTVGKAVALAILAILLGFGWVVILHPLLSGLASRNDRATQLSELIVRLNRSAAQAPALSAVLEKSGGAARGRDALFASASPVQAAAALHAEVRRIADANGAQLRSIQELPIGPENALDRIGVRAELQSDTSQLVHFLYDLEAHMPLLIVRRLAVQGSEQANFLEGQRPLLSIQVDIVAFVGSAE